MCLPGIPRVRETDTNMSDQIKTMKEQVQRQREYRAVRPCVRSRERPRGHSIWSETQNNAEQKGGQKVGGQVEETSIANSEC